MEGKKVLVLGGGLSGLSAAHWLTRQGVEAEVVERAAEVGGLARTIERNGFRYDFGGYRFFSRSPEIQELLKSALEAAGQRDPALAATNPPFVSATCGTTTVEIPCLTKLAAKRLGLNTEKLKLATQHFRRPAQPGEQLALF